MLRGLVVLLVLGFAEAASAAPAQPYHSDAIAAMEVGISCAPKVTGYSPAPDTRLGYTNRIDRAPKIISSQLLAPAALGVAMSINFELKRPLRGVRNVLYYPDSAKPEGELINLGKGSGRHRGFTFEFPNELILGLWRFEAWDGDTLLYRVEFEVVPAEAFADILGECQGMA